MDKNTDPNLLKVILDRQDINQDTVRDIFDEKLTEALISGSNHIFALLRPEMGSDQKLLKWVAEWKKIFAEKGKYVSFLSDDLNQINALQLYREADTVSASLSQEDLESIYNDLQQKEISVLDIKNIFDNLETIDSIIEKKSEDNTSILVVGSNVNITGEYMCQGCGYKDFFMNGNVVPSCSQTNCPTPDSGWQLLFGLF